MNLEHLISLPPNKSMMVHDNEIMIKPFGLFPPPASTAGCRVSRWMTE